MAGRVPGANGSFESVTSDPTAVTHHTPMMAVGTVNNETDEVTRTMCSL